ncbi:MAG: hypothetical protein K6U75_02980 [Firmicutes bacterium]|nr:hypothetical protein [Bacillota bacterium]
MTSVPTPTATPAAVSLPTVSEDAAANPRVSPPPPQMIIQITNVGMSTSKK